MEEIQALVGERKNELWIMLSMILRWRCSATRKAYGLESIWPEHKDVGAYSLVEPSLGSLSHSLKYNSLWLVDKFY